METFGLFKTKKAFKIEIQIEVFAFSIPGKAKEAVWQSILQAPIFIPFLFFTIFAELLPSRKAEAKKI